MASRNYLRAKFEALPTEKERVEFPWQYLGTDLCRDGADHDVLPQGYAQAALSNMAGALKDAGRPDVWDRFWRELQRSIPRSKR